MTSKLVPLECLLQLAQLGRRMRRAQNRYFLARRNGGRCHEELREATQLERWFDEAIETVYEMERQPFPEFAAELAEELRSTTKDGTGPPAT